MSSPAVGAKYVAAAVVGLVGAGTFAGVSHDGRGGAPPEDPVAIVEATSPTSTVPATVLPSSSQLSSSPPSSSRQVETTLATQPAEPAQPAAPDPVPTRARLRSRGS